MVKKVIKILSIDGGGIRGIIPLYVLAEIERQTGQRIADMFDLIAGTSVGGILAMACAIPDENGKAKYTAEDLIKMYKEVSPRMFQQSGLMKYFPLFSTIKEKYTNDHIRAGFHKYVGTTKISEATTEILVTSFELESDRPFLFKRWKARENEKMDFTMLDVILAATAAPVYFKPYVVKPKDPTIKHYAFLDGGIVANNPAMCAYVEAKTLFPDADEYLLVSLGTGDYTAKILLENIKRWGAISWLRPIIDIFMGGASELVDHELKTLHATPADKLNHYFRLQVRLMQDELRMDDTRPIKFHILSLLAQDVVKEKKGEITEICKLLTSH